jgi:flagellar hook protein FlgE
MMRSMFAGVSGLRAHQLMMDVVGDNIANVNTAGFKSSRVVFADTLSQLVRGGSGPSQGRGGVNPMQIGLGTRVSAVDVTDTQGAMQNTGRPTDVAIQGSGLFVVRNGTETVFTRAGSFGFDAGGNLVDPTGMIVQGWLVDPATGTIPTTEPVADLRLPLGGAIPPVATTEVTVGGNLSAEAAAGTVVKTTITVVDSDGTSHNVSIEMTKTANPNEWTVAARDGAGNPLTEAGGSTTLAFSPAGGALLSPAPGAFPSYTLTAANGATSTFRLDLGAPGASGAITQYGGNTTAVALEQNGSTSGYLRSFAISDDGTVSGVFSNGRSQVLGQLALATFTNPAGLAKAGETHFRATGSSGLPLTQVPGRGGAGTLAAGSLEMSNVDLAQEFTNLIIAQRGFQANSRIISASDEMLQDLVNLKR